MDSFNFSQHGSRKESNRRLERIDAAAADLIAALEELDPAQKAVVGWRLNRFQLEQAMMVVRRVMKKAKIHRWATREIRGRAGLRNRLF